MAIFGSNSRRRGESGFVLITVMWLVVLAGSISALLLLISVNDGRALRTERDRLQGKLDLEAAIQTALADRLFRGPASTWWLVPAERSVTVAGQPVVVRIESESGRLDVNEADMALIDSALRGFGTDAATRNHVIAELSAIRARGGRVRSLDELAALIGQEERADRNCLIEDMTIASGLAEPRQDQMSARLARALGRPGTTPPGPAAPEAGAALRIRASSVGLQGVTVVVRPTGARDKPIAIGSWSAGNFCNAQPDRI